MRTWQDYKNYIKSIDSESQRDMEQIEELSAIVSSIIKRRNELGIKYPRMRSGRALILSAKCRISSSLYRVMDIPFGRYSRSKLL